MDARGEVRQALVALGYATAEVTKTVDALPDDPDAAPEQLLREALRALGKR
jgi:Holliday junction resolvasome RuvABC DNA-binding subunit